MNKKKCPQTKCLFNQIGFGCKCCEVCGCEPNIVDEDCDKCFNCYRDEGILRWTDNNHKDDDKQKEKNKEQTKKQKVIPYIN